MRFRDSARNRVPQRLIRLISRPDLGPGTRIQFAVGWLILTLVIGAIGLTFSGEDRSFWNSLWLALITTTTVGYGDDVPETFMARLVTVAILTNGFLSVSVATASFVELLVEGGITKLLGGRSLETQIAKLEGHYIVCGYGRMGRLICREIQERVPIVVIEKSEESLPTLLNDDRLYLLGDATEEEVLEKAGIDRALGLVSVVASDAENVFIVLTAREMSRNLYILARAIDERSERKLLRAGANKVISPYLIGGVRMAQAILKPAVVDFMEFVLHSNTFDVQVEEILIKNQSVLAGQKLQSSGISTLNIIVLAVKRATGRMEFNPSRETLINEGDTLIVMGPAPGMTKLEHKADPTASN